MSSQIKSKKSSNKTEKSSYINKFDCSNSTNIIIKKEEKLIIYKLGSFNTQKKVINQKEMTMTEQQKQTEISRRVKNYWLREKKNKLVCLIGIGQTLKEAIEEKTREEVGDMRHIPALISQFRPNLFPEIAHMKHKLVSSHGRLPLNGTLRPSHIINQRVKDWTTKNEKKIKKKMMKLLVLSTKVNNDKSITASFYTTFSMNFKNPLKKEFKKCEIVYDKEVSNDLGRKKINYFDVLDWKSSVFSQIKYWRHFCGEKDWGHPDNSETLHHNYSRLYKGIVNAMTRLSFNTSNNQHLGRWFNPYEYSSSQSRPSIQVVGGDEITDEEEWNGAKEVLTSRNMITNAKGELAFIRDFVPHIELTHDWEKISKWSPLKWKTVSAFNLVPKMCSALNISITTFKKLYLAMLKDLKKRTFVCDPHIYKEKSLWAIFYNKWSQKGSNYKKIIYDFKNLYLSDGSNNNLTMFDPTGNKFNTNHINLTFKNEVAGTEYEIDFTELIVMAMLVGSKGSLKKFPNIVGQSFPERPLYIYARNYDGLTQKEKDEKSSYIINRQLYPQLCSLKATNSQGKIHAYY